MLLAFFSVSAQEVSVSVSLDQDQFLPSEAVPVTIHIINRSGQSLHLGAETNWLTFSIESADGFVVFKNADPPVIGAFDLGSSEVATKRVNVQPYFTLAHSSRYHVTATVRIKEWDKEISSAPGDFDVIDGAKLWSQVFGVPSSAGATNGEPEVRKYTLEEANYLRSQLRLYVQVSNESESRVFKVRSLGRMVSFGQPEEQIDRSGNLHVLCQSGASIFTYAVVNPDGDILQQEIYDYVTIRPKLGANASGDIGVAGGVRRPNPDELPNVNQSAQVR